MQAAHPKAGEVELAKLLAAAWKDLAEEDRAVFEAQHQVRGWVGGWLAGWQHGRLRGAERWGCLPWPCSFALCG